MALTEGINIECTPINNHIIKSWWIKEELVMNDITINTYNIELLKST